MLFAKLGSLAGSGGLTHIPLSRSGRIEPAGEGDLQLGSRDGSDGSVKRPPGFACEISNASAMSQLISILDPTAPAASIASRPKMGPDDNNRSAGHGAPATSVITKVKPKTKRPNLYRVLILNDDYTPMEFVVHVLERFFQKDVEAATKIMLHVHHHGIGECGVFTYEIAETKVTQVMDFARKHQHPLQCVMEKK